jgi:hypothetical protein
MTPKEKAEELKEKCDGYACYAEVAVDEIINNVLVGIDLAATWGDYWVKVKKEIEKL